MARIDVRFAQVETGIERAMVTNIRWLVGLTFGLYALMLGLILFVVARELPHALAPVARSRLAERVYDLVGRGHRDAQAADHHTRRGAGQLGRAPGAEAGDHAQRQHGDDGIPSAGHVE